MPASRLPSGWVPLASTNVRAARYDEDSATLSVVFHSGGEYDYYNVSPQVAAGLFEAASPGRYVKDVLNGFSYSGG